MWRLEAGVITEDIRQDPGELNQGPAGDVRPKIG